MIENKLSFKDHFPRQAGNYARFRPRYPSALFEFVAAAAPNDLLALDCATGNGQAAVALAGQFRKVIAIDASAEQIASAQPSERVEYRVASAESTGLSAHTISTITVAQALHWFDREAFYVEARRVLQPRGLLAVWAYNYLRIAPEVDPLARRFHDEIVGPYWPPERKLVGSGYRELPFPFQEIQTPEFQIEVRWSLAHLLGYLRTWSATQGFMAANRRDPVELIESQLDQAWGNSAEEKLAIWPLTVRIGRV
jgi:SAM-dependent methyltransferase